MPLSDFGQIYSVEINRSYVLLRFFDGRKLCFNSQSTCVDEVNLYLVSVHLMMPRSNIYCTLAFQYHRFQHMGAFLHIALHVQYIFLCRRNCNHLEQSHPNHVSHRLAKMGMGSMCSSKAFRLQRIVSISTASVFAGVWICWTACLVLVNRRRPETRSFFFQKRISQISVLA